MTDKLEIISATTEENRFNKLRIFASPIPILALAVIFSIPALLGGYIQDDNFFLLKFFFADQFALSDKPALSPFGLFSLGNGSTEQSAALVDQGLAPWWITPEFKFNLFRPLAEWSHAIDFTLWPHSTLLTHLHSLFWFCIIVVSATRFFRNTLGNTPAAGLAALLFCLDSNFGWVNGWIASRNTLMCLALSLVAINLHIESFSGDRRKRALAPFIFALAMLCGEYALSCLGVILATTFYHKDNPMTKKAESKYAIKSQLKPQALAAIPYLFIFLAWAILYIKNGYGVQGSADYIAPFKDPYRFSMHLLTQAPDIIFQEIYFIAFTLFGDAPVLSLSWGIGIVGIITFLVIYLKIHSENKLFWLVLLLLVSVPASAGSGGSRVAMFMNLSISAMLAQTVLSCIKERGVGFRKIYGWTLVALKTIMLPLTLLSPIILNQFDVQNVITPALTLPFSEADKNRTLVMVNPLYEPASRLFRPVRLWNKLPVSELQYSLSNGSDALEITRQDANSLLLTPKQGFASTSGERFMRDIYSKPFQINDVLTFKEMKVNILSVTKDGRPKSVKFEFERTLEDSKYLWLQCAKGKFSSWEPPKIGETIFLNGCEAM